MPASYATAAQASHTLRTGGGATHCLNVSFMLLPQPPAALHAGAATATVPATTNALGTWCLGTLLVWIDLIGSMCLRVLTSRGGVDVGTAAPYHCVA